MTAANVLDTIHRLLGMAGRSGTDPVSAYTQVKMKHAPRLRKLPETERPTPWITLPRNRRPANWDKIDDPVSRSNEKQFGGTANWKSYKFDKTTKQVKCSECKNFHPKDKLFLSVYVDDIKIVASCLRRDRIEMRVFGKNWSALRFVDSQYTCKSSHKVEQNL